MKPKRQLYQTEISEPKSSSETDEAWNEYYSELKATLPGTAQEREEIIRKRILKFFGEFKIDSENFFCVRKEVDRSNKLMKYITRKVLLYGVDYMTESRIKEYFQEYCVDVTKVDDSHAVIEFESQGECLEALLRKTTNMKPFSTANQLMKLTKDGWIQLESYQELVFRRKLMARFLTSLDNFSSNPSRQKNQLYHAYQKAKQKFINQMKERSTKKSDDLDKKSNVFISRPQQSKQRFRVVEDKKPLQSIYPAFSFTQQQRVIFEAGRNYERLMNRKRQNRREQSFSGQLISKEMRSENEDSSSRSRSRKKGNRNVHLDISSNKKFQQYCKRRDLKKKETRAKEKCVMVNDTFGKINQSLIRPSKDQADESIQDILLEIDKGKDSKRQQERKQRKMNYSKKINKIASEKDEAISVLSISDINFSDLII